MSPVSPPRIDLTKCLALFTILQIGNTEPQVAAGRKANGSQTIPSLILYQIDSRAAEY